MKECAYCGRKFQANSGKQIYCCRECHLASKRKNAKPKICEICGSEFIPKQPRQKYCTYECGQKARYEFVKIKKAMKENTPIPCKRCGKEFIPSHHSEKYCSATCRTLYHRELIKKKKYQPKQCVICGDVFTPTRKDQVTCPKPECKKEQERRKQYERFHSLKFAEGHKPKKKRYTIKEWNALTPSERWELMTLDEVLAENIKYHIPTYGKSETLARWGKLPEDYGKRERKLKNNEQE
jgi:hypothetical protein